MISICDIVIPKVLREGADLFALRDSISKVGVLKPILVKRRPNGGFRVLDGVQRIAACKLLGIILIPAVVRVTLKDKWLANPNLSLKDFALKLKKSKSWVLDHLDDHE